MACKGIDVSHWQGDIEWQKVKESGVDFAFIRASEGHTITDSRFSQNIKEAKAAGIVVGAYHFFHGKSNQEAEKEAAHFIGIIGDLGGFGELDLPCVLDVENQSLPKGELSSYCKTWLERIEGLSGVRPLIYTYPWYASAYLDSSLASYPLWLASWQENAAPCPPWDGWMFWQYTDKGDVPGIQTKVDMNQYEGSMDDFMVKMSVEDANKVIAFLSAGWFVAEGKEGADEFKRLANELRKVSGQDVQ